MKDTLKIKTHAKNINYSIKPQIFCILIFSFLIYSNTLFNKYTLDDTLIITQNKFTKMGIEGIPKILSNDAFVGFFGENKNLLPGGRYRPLSQVIFAVVYDVAGLNPFPGHLINIISYSLLSLLVFLTLNRLINKNSSLNLSQSSVNILNIRFNIPFIATMLFAAHPLHTEAVANIKGLDEILNMLLSVYALFFVLLYIDKKKFFYLPLALFVFFLALITKENSIAFFAIIPLSLFVFRKLKLNEYAVIIASLLIPVLSYFIIRKLALGFIFSNLATEKELLNNPFLFATIAEKYATIMLTWGKYLALLIAPVTLTHDYYPKQIPVINWADIRAILPLLIYGALTVYAIYFFFKKDLKANKNFHKLLSFAILFYLLTFGMQSNLVFNIGTFMNERFVFVSLLGFCIALAYFFNKALLKNKSWVYAFIILLTLYSAKTFSRNFVWYDDFTLFTTDVNTSSNSAKCNVSAGGMHYEKAKVESDSTTKNNHLNKSLGYLGKGLQLHPQYVAGWMLMGNVYLELKDFSNARISYENILNIAGEHKDALNNLLYVAQTSDKNNNTKDAILSFRTLLKYKPDNPDYLYQFASALAKSGRVDTALVILNNLVVNDPNSYNAYNKLGEVYGRYLNDMNTSIKYLLKAYSIKPDDASILENLGVAYGIVGDFNLSRNYFKKSLKITPDNAQVYRNLSNTYRSMGKLDSANYATNKAYEIENKK